MFLRFVCLVRFLGSLGAVLSSGIIDKLVGLVDELRIHIVRDTAG